MNSSTTLATTVLAALSSTTLAALYMLGVPGFIFFSYLASLPLFLLGLSLGLRPVYGAGTLATLLILLLQGPFACAEFFLFSVLGPTFLLYRVLLNRKKSSGEISWYPSSLLLRDFTFACAFVMVLALGGYLYLTQGGDPQTFIKPLLSSLDPQGHMRDAEPLLIKILPVLPGFFAFSWGVMVLVNGSLAQGLLVRFNKNLRPSPSFEALKAPNYSLVALGISLLLSLLGIGYIDILGKNTALVLTFSFFLVGLGVIHRWLHKTSYATIGLTLFYLLLGFFLWPIVCVILVGILKPWIEKSNSSN